MVWPKTAKNLANLNDRGQDFVCPDKSSNQNIYNGTSELTYNPFLEETAMTWYERRKARAKALIAHVLGTTCAKCGAADGPLQIDHIDRSQKKFTLSKHTRSLEDRIAELKKCQLLCVPCHQAKTAGEHKTFVRGKVMEPCGKGTEGAYQAGCRCPDCRAAHAECKKRYLDRQRARVAAQPMTDVERNAFAALRFLTPRTEAS